ncbi:hypothetical protein SLEP1_g2797 [Rubroshorea leprosula]|uniref:RING-type E3 ubiquitin transferase n=1 Tax=Rubroshorea leprosula TaxID=152421 RepID=A0AAV5HP53_9ROSI|nr:hypothetical protein SLEP1_g2797 [Rubroshorea leprosula]
MSVAPPPPPLFLNNIGGSGGDSHSSSSDMEGIKPSILIIILILLITIIVSVSLCLLLRHLNSRCLRHLFRPASVVATGSSRISPAQTTTSSVADSLPMFTFSSITRRTATASVISGDCAICLSKFEAQDQLRLLPLCCHAFHTECIDTWLNSNQSCPLCRFPIYASEAEVLKILLSSSNGGVHDSFDGSDSFRIEIGTVSRRQTDSESGERRRSYSIGSFDYIVDGLSEVSMNITNQRSASDKEEVGGTEAEGAAAAPEENLAAEIANGRSWLKEYIDRLSFSASSRALSFRSSGRFFTGSSRRSDVAGVGDWDVEANRAGEEISEYFRWLSGV